MIVKWIRRQQESRVTLALSLVACAIGTLWQLYAVCVDYFAYGVVSEVSLVKVYNIEPPVLSLCLPYVDLVNLTAFGVIANRSASDWRNAAYRRLQEEVTVARLWNATPDLGSLVTRSWCREPDSYNLLTGLAIRKYMRDDLVCYRIAHPLQESQPGFSLKSHQVTYGKRGGGLLGMRLAKRGLRNVSRAIVFLHPIDMYPRGDRDYALFLASDSAVFDEDSTFWTISWCRTIQVALEPPFVTRCRDNQAIGFENREHCEHACVAERTLAALKRSVFTTTILTPMDVTVLSSESLLLNRSLQQLVERFISDCNDSCWGQNCVRVNYMPLVTSTLKDRESIVFQVYDQNSLETRITFQPKLPFVSFLVYVLSIVGFWFGVSCLDLLHSLLRMTRHADRRLQRRCCGDRQVVYCTGHRQRLMHPRHVMQMRRPTRLPFVIDPRDRLFRADAVYIPNLAPMMHASHIRR